MRLRGVKYVGTSERLHASRLRADPGSFHVSAFTFIDTKCNVALSEFTLQSSLSFFNKKTKCTCICAHARGEMQLKKHDATRYPDSETEIQLFFFIVALL